MPRPRVAASVRLILAMFRLYANLEAGFGQAVLDILKKQYPDQAHEIDLTPMQIGRQMVNKAKKEVQNDEQAAYDVVQDWLVKVTKAQTDFRGDKVDKETGEVTSQGAKTWRQALNNIINNVRKQGISKSQQKYRDNTPDEDKYAGKLWLKGKADAGEKGFTWDERKEKELQALAKKLKDQGVDPSTVQPKRPSRDGQRTQTLDEAFGKRGEDGGDPTGGEGAVPADAGIGGGGSMSRPLDDKAALKSFYELIDEHIPELKRTLSDETRPLFELIFDYDIGSFRSAIDENMGQASELASMLTSGEIEMREETVTDESGKKVKKDVPGTGTKTKGYPTEQSKKQYEDHAKRWTGYVGDLRKKLLDEIWEYVRSYMTPQEFAVLRERFFRDTDAKSVRGLEKKKEQDRDTYQRGIDERKVARIKWELENGQPKRAKELESLTRKYGEEELSKIGPKQDPGASDDKGKYAHLLHALREAEAKAEAVKNDPKSSKGAKERAGSAVFQAKKELKPVADKLTMELGKQFVDGIPANENPEGSAKTTQKLREQRSSTLLSIAARIASS